MKTARQARQAVIQRRQELANAPMMRVFEVVEHGRTKGQYTMGVASVRLYLSKGYHVVERTNGLLELRK